MGILTASIGALLLTGMILYERRCGAVCAIALPRVFVNEADLAAVCIDRTVVIIT